MKIVRRRQKGYGALREWGLLHVHRNGTSWGSTTKKRRGTGSAGEGQTTRFLPPGAKDDDSGRTSREEVKHRSEALLNFRGKVPKRNVGHLQKGCRLCCGETARPSEGGGSGGEVLEKVSRGNGKS